ncbi:MAG: ThiF family adenylyltransferase [Clostridia bacterium]|nr:ThiF family adenylyltransferase [Clostridia bacterium]
MKLALDRPVQIVIIGAGGTGGYVIPHLYRIAYASNRKCRIIIADGDIVEDKNLVRQCFSSVDVGENKATVMAERYADVFGVETEYVPDFIEDEDELYNLLEVPRPPSYSNMPYPVSILIGAVDNNRSRVMCNEFFKRMDNIIYIDAGNAESGGQVVCGAKVNGKVISKPVARVYPDILQDVEKFPSELSCAERSVSAPQSIAANLFASTAISTMLYYLLIKGELKTTRIAFSANKLLMKSIA